MTSSGLGRMLDVQHPLPVDVFITDELRRRTPKRANCRREKLALLELAARMADRPDEVLPSFVALAMRIAGGTSAGLSLYEPDPAPGVFRWHHVHGVLAALSGATTPRHYSPCGITLDQAAPVLTRHPDRYYDWIAATKISVPEVLLVPLYVGSREPVGTLWIVADAEGHFHRGHARMATELAAFVSAALRVQQGEQRIRRALEEQQTLTREMSHRVKNLFALTDSMIRYVAKGAGSKDEMLQTLSDRMQALASAHTLAMRGSGEGEKLPSTSDLGEIIGAVVAPYQNVGGSAAARLSLCGPPFALGYHAVSGIALVLHELATNAAKYGALTSEEGRVSIDWQVAGDSLMLRWAERGGPPIEVVPTLRSFGSRLAHGTIVRQFQGTLDYDWRRDGLSVTMAIPVSRLTA